MTLRGHYAVCNRNWYRLGCSASSLATAVGFLSFKVMNAMIVGSKN